MVGEGLYSDGTLDRDHRDREVEQDRTGPRRVPPEGGMSWRRMLAWKGMRSQVPAHVAERIDHAVRTDLTDRGLSLERRIAAAADLQAVGLLEVK